MQHGVSMIAFLRQYAGSRRRLGAAILLFMTAATLAPPAAHAENWPTWRHDNRRSGITPEAIDAENLTEAWTWRSAAPPAPAWAGPAKWDAYATVVPLESMRDFDSAFHIAAATDPRGDAVFFGSSADDTLYCLDADTGAVRWTFTADGPIRLSPTWDKERVYFGSDDGHAYCLASKDGYLLWKHKPSPPDEEQISLNGRLISPWPVRTGVIVQDGTACFAASMLPWQTSYLCALDAATGAGDGEGRYTVTRDGTTFEGPLVASPSRLYITRGRVPPTVYDRATGRRLGDVPSGGGGAFALLTPDLHLIHGPGNKTAQLSESSGETAAVTAATDEKDRQFQDLVAQYAGARRMVVTETTSYVHLDASLAALRRSDRQTLWSTASRAPHSLILAGETLFAGGDYVVEARSAATGEIVWTAPVEGKAASLAVANGLLYVSTSAGAIHAFRAAPESP